MHQNQAQLRSKLWYIPKATAQCGDLQPHQAGWHTQRAVVLPLSQMNLPHRAGGHIKRAIILPLSHEPAPLGGGAHPKGKGHCLSTLTNEPSHWAGGLTQRAIILPLSQTNLPHHVEWRAAVGGFRAARGGVLLKPQERKKRLIVLNKQTNSLAVIINKTQKNTKPNLEDTHHQSEVKTSTLPPGCICLH